MLFFSCRYTTATKPLEAKVLKITNFGSPEAVLKLETQTIQEIPKSNVVVRMKAAPITHHDLAVIQGHYKAPDGIPPAGTEGFGEIIAVAPDLPQSLVGKHVIPFKPFLGTWRTHLVAHHEDLLTIPKTLLPGQAATLVSSLVASQLLNLLRLREGDVIVQSAAAGTVGLAVVQLAARKGVKTINFFRPTVQVPEITEQLKVFGGTIACPEPFADTYDFREIVNDLPPPRLALDCIGGPSATRVIKLLGKGGTFVSFGSLSQSPIQVPPSSLFNNDIKLRGFSLLQWQNSRSREDLQKLIDELTEKPVAVWTEHFNFDDFSRALTAHNHPFRHRKILLVMSP